MSCERGRGKERNGPLHALGVVRIASLAFSAGPHSYGAVVASRNELAACGSPIARHDAGEEGTSAGNARRNEDNARSDVALVDLSRGAEVANIKGVEVVVLGGAEKNGRLQGVKNELVDPHLHRPKRQP